MHIHSEPELRRAPVFPALNKPALTGGIDGGMWAVVIAVSVAVAIRLHSAIAGGMIAVPLWFGASAMAKAGPEALPIYIAATRLKGIYDGSMRPNDRMFPDE